VGRSARRRRLRTTGAAHGRMRWQVDGRRRKLLRIVTRAADRRKADHDAQRRVSKAQREWREDFQPNGALHARRLATGPIQPLRVEECVRVVLRVPREPARVRRILSTANSKWNRLLKCDSIDDVIEVLPEGVGGGGSCRRRLATKPSSELATGYTRRSRGCSDVKWRRLRGSLIP